MKNKILKTFIIVSAVIGILFISAAINFAYADPSEVEAVPIEPTEPVGPEDFIPKVYL